LVQRLRDIEAELKQMPTSEGKTRPTPASHCLDRSFFADLVSKSKRARATGTMLDHNAFVPLRHYKMVDMQKLQSRMDALYNEECDILIRLREFQLDGIHFEFQ
jgi:hypothetical protein